MERIVPAVSEPRTYSFKGLTGDEFKATRPAGEHSVGDSKKEIAEMQFDNSGLDWMAGKARFLKTTKSLLA